MVHANGSPTTAYLTSADWLPSTSVRVSIAWLYVAWHSARLVWVGFH